MGEGSPVVNSPEMEILDQEEFDAIEEAFALVEDPSSRKRKTTPVIGLLSDRRQLPDWSSTSALRIRRITSDCEIDSPDASSANSDNSGRRVTRSMVANSNPRDGIWNLNPPSCRFPSKMEYPSIRFPGKVIYSRTASDAESAARELLDIVNAKKKEMTKISVGLDIEWRPTFRRGDTPRRASVMQLCVDAFHCFVLHIIHSGIPPLLHSLFEDETIPKVGVGIANDASKILNDYGVRVKGLEDLSGLANRKFDGAPKKWGLSSLTEMLICKQLEKPKKIRLGNWEAAMLSNEQLQYAATDAYASWYLHQVLDAIPDTSKPSDADERATGVEL